MPGALYALPGDNVTGSATLSWIVSSANASYPLSNLATPSPDTPAKAIAATATLRATFATSRTLEGVALINCGFPGVTIHLDANGGMAQQALTVPAPEDGLCVNALFDLRSVGSRQGTRWDLSVVGAPGQVAIGALLLLTSLRELRTKWDYSIEEEAPVIEARTSYRKRLQYRVPVRVRRLSYVCEWAEDREALRTLRRSAQGTFLPWVLVPDEDDPDVVLVQFADTKQKETYHFHQGRFDAATVEGLVEQAVDVEEVNAGVSLV